jgi:hypothetical protein
MMIGRCKSVRTDPRPEHYIGHLSGHLSPTPPPNNSISNDPITEPNPDQWAQKTSLRGYYISRRYLYSVYRQGYFLK